MKFVVRHRDLIIEGLLFFAMLAMACAADGIGDWVYAIL